MARKQVTDFDADSFIQSVLVSTGSFCLGFFSGAVAAAGATSDAV